MDKSGSIICANNLRVRSNSTVLIKSKQTKKQRQNDSIIRASYSQSTVENDCTHFKVNDGKTENNELALLYLKARNSNAVLLLFVLQHIYSAHCSTISRHL